LKKSLVLEVTFILGWVQFPCHQNTSVNPCDGLNTHPIMFLKLVLHLIY
jgi:hypothetical protein